MLSEEMKGLRKALIILAIYFILLIILFTAFFNGYISKITTIILFGIIEIIGIWYGIFLINKSNIK